MAAKIYLIAPETPDPDDFPARLDTVLGAASVAALLLTVGADDALARQFITIAQSHDCAVMLRDQPDLVRKLGADGVHITGGQKAFAEAVKSLSPNFMVGAGDLHSRHEAMLRGEAGADYLMFGPLSGIPSPEDRDLAQWWTEAFEPPCVFSQPGTPLDVVEDAGYEFVALGETLWRAPDPARAIKTLSAGPVSA
jgi:thiamine-phosphate pyrophosphorylase